MPAAARLRLPHVAMLAAVACLASVAASCRTTDPALSAAPIACGDEARQAIDCSSELSYQGTKTEGGFSVAQIAGGNAAHEEVALRRVDEETERFLAMQTRLCRDYNACVLDKPTYQRESASIRDRLGRVPGLIDAVKVAASPEARQVALDALYRTAVPDDRRPEEVTLRFGMRAKLPPSQGGKTIQVLPGSVIPTGARVSFEIAVSQDAYAYIFQVSPKGDLTVLFPDPQIAVGNPLKGGETTEIPGGGQSYRLDDNDLGTERVLIAIAREPIDDLAASLKKVAGGKVTALGDDGLLASVAAIDEGGPKCKTRGLVLEAGPAQGCSRSRGLVLDEPDAARRTTSLSARTEPGDSRIVKAFPFEHVTEKAYASAPPSRRRGATIEE